MIQDIARNLYAGARLCFMLPVDRAGFRTGLDQAFALLVFGTATILLIEFATSDGEWFPPADRVGFYALAVLAGLVGCFAVTRLLGVTEGLSGIVVMLLAGTFWLVPVFAPVFALADAETLAPDRPAGAFVGIVMVLWFLGIAVRAIHLTTAGSLIGPTIAASVLVIIMAVPKMLLTTPSAWVPAPAKLPPTWTQENLYYGQFGMMERALEWVGRDQPGVPDTFFVGFGADARAPVFVNEMRAAARIFEQRFGAKDRSVVLINSQSTVRRAPLANVHNLGRALSDIGKRMNPEEDVLILYISAPALKGGTLAPRFDPLNFASFRSADIRTMLDDAGIKYRAIVLSACIIDEFIEPLRSPTTLIVAAAADGGRARGCTGDADFTEFGGAFLDEALRASYSIPEAFELTRTLLEERDAGGLRAPSHPAIFVGHEISAKMAELAERLEVENDANTAAPTDTAPRIRSSRTLRP